jgi:hypothetical protein
MHKKCGTCKYFLNDELGYGCKPPLKEIFEGMGILSVWNNNNGMNPDNIADACECYEEADNEN